MGSHRCVLWGIAVGRLTSLSQVRLQKGGGDGAQGSHDVPGSSGPRGNLVKLKFLAKAKTPSQEGRNRFTISSRTLVMGS